MESEQLSYRERKSIALEKALARMAVQRAREAQFTTETHVSSLADQAPANSEEGGLYNEFRDKIRKNEI